MSCDVYNSPVRAAGGLGVPPSKQDEAPQWSTPLILHDGQLVLTPSVTGYDIVCGVAGVVYVHADTMTELIPWLTRLALAMDNQS